MNQAGRVDPELVAPLEAILTFVGGRLDLYDIPAVRAMMDPPTMTTQVPVFEGVIVEDRRVPGLDGAPDVAVRIYQPSERPATLPALLWMRGGGYIMGNLEADDQSLKELVKAVDCLVVSVEYRLAPEQPFPAALDDCYAALTWLATHAAELGVEPGRIAVGGGSAGGGLAAALTLLARDRAEVQVAFQLLLYAVIDDRNVTPPSATVPDTLPWSRENNLIAWRSYLGQEPGGEDISPYAAAFRATDLTDLPPAYIAVGDLDLFLNENIAYVQRLLAAGVPTELHVYPRAYHGFDLFAPNAAVAQRFNADRDAVLKRALHR